MMAVNHTRLPDSEIVTLVHLKNKAGVEVLYDTYARALFLAILRIVPQKENAENILEQSFIEIWNSFDLYLVQEEKLITWMIKIARKLAKDSLKFNVVSMTTIYEADNTLDKHNMIS